MIPDPTMLDALRSELEINIPKLGDGLLALETHPESMATLDAVMGAAHSIKGAGGAVKLDAVFRLAHAMEWCLVAVKGLAFRLEADHMDILLKGHDRFREIATDPAAYFSEDGKTDGLISDVLKITEAAHVRPLEAAIRTLDNDPTAAAAQIVKVGEALAGNASQWIVLPEVAGHVAHALEDALSAVERSGAKLGAEQAARLRDRVAELHAMAGDVSPPLEEPAVGEDEGEILSRIGCGLVDRSPAFDGEDAMVGLFRAEVDASVRVLNDGLLALEKNPEALETLKQLTGAAGTIESGAKTVAHALESDELSAAIRISHAMKACFDAFHRRGARLHADQIAMLLKGVELISRIAERPDDVLSESEIRAFLSDMDAVGKFREGPSKPSTAHTSSSGPTSTPSPDKTTPVVSEATASEKELMPMPETVPARRARSIEVSRSGLRENVSALRGADKERMVRVSAAKIERLMGLAGEVVVSAQWYPRFFQRLLELKQNHATFSKRIDEIQRLIQNGGGDGRLEHVINKVRETLDRSGFGMADCLHQLDRFTSGAELLSDRLYNEVIGVRMCPFSERTGSYPRMVRDLARRLGKKVRLEILGENTEVDRDVLEKLDSPVNHLLRNALDHGIELPSERRSAGKPEFGTVRLEAVHQAGMLRVTVTDDGRGVHFDFLRKRLLEKGRAPAEDIRRMSESELMEFLFLEGFTTSDQVTEISGRGYGLNVVYKTVHDIGGTVRADSMPGNGMQFILELPLTRSVIRTFLIDVAGELYAFPLARIDRCLQIERKDIDIVEDRQYFRYDNQNIALVDIRDVLEIDSPDPRRDVFSVVVISHRSRAYGMVVDAFRGECDLVVRPLAQRLGKIPDISAAAIMMDGTPVLIFDVEDLVHSIGGMLDGRRRLKKIESGVDAERQPPKRILVVDDSFIVREKERKILENKGYQVEDAKDGMDGWNLLRLEPFDMVLTDIDMPRMDGVELIRNIKQDDRLKSIPVIVVSYKDSEEDRLAGLKAGADWYLHKKDFDDATLTDIVADLIGEA